MNGWIFLKVWVSEEGFNCHYCFSDKSLRFQSVCDGCHDLLMMYIDINSIAILNVQGIDYRCITVGISKSEIINLFQKC